MPGSERIPHVDQISSWSPGLGLCRVTGIVISDSHLIFRQLISFPFTSWLGKPRMESVGGWDEKPTQFNVWECFWGQNGWKHFPNGVLFRFPSTDAPQAVFPPSSSCWSAAGLCRNPKCRETWWEDEPEIKFNSIALFVCSWQRYTFNLVEGNI